MTERALSPASVRRIEVLALRQRLERAVAGAVDASCDPFETGEQTQIHKRLVCILSAGGPLTGPDGLYGLMVLARHVYSASSDVLHGRASMVNVPEVMVDEWREVVSRLEKVSSAIGEDLTPENPDPPPTD